MIKKYKKLIIILGIIILPLIYSFFYLKAFWNPYGNLDDIPVALVNLDKCEDSCKSDELIKALKDKGTFAFEVVSEKEAEDGLINKDYYAVITIPENFTSSFDNASSLDREQTSITYMPNKKSNYLASQIIGNAVSEVEANLIAEVNQTIVKKLTESIQAFPKETEKVALALAKLENGSNNLSKGANTLYSGLNDLTLGYEKFHNGVNTLSSNTNNLLLSYKQFDGALSDVEVGVDTLKTSASELTTLKTNIDNLNEASKQLNSSFQAYNGISSQVFDDANNTYEKIIAYYNKHPEVINDSDFMEILKIAEDYTSNNKIENVKSMENSLLENSNAFTSGFNELGNNTDKLNEFVNGINTLDSSLSLITDNSGQILNGIDRINSGIIELNNNSNSISSGLNQSLSGMGALENGLYTFDSSINNVENSLNSKFSETDNEVKNLEGLDSYAKEPVNTVEKDYGEYEEYGIFFAPYFMSLSLWVGGIMIMMGLYYDPDQRFKVLGRKSNQKILRLVLYNIIAIIQALILGFILKLCLGFTVTNYLLYYGSCILISMVFLVIIMFLFFNFKDVGRFLALLFLILQLTACAGTFPIETVPDFFKAIYPFIPMTYSVDLLRESFVSIDSDFVLRDVSILLLWLFVFTILILITGYFKQKKEQKSL